MTTANPPTPISVWRPIDTDTFLLGTPHYPEHVDESYWERDAERMAAAGFNTVRLAEFAWHIMEPREGVFDFDLFDRAIAVLGRHGIKTIMCTPTATPPRWLTMHYPEVLRVDVNGRQMSHGSRQHADTSNPVFRAHSRRITQAMMEHYRDNADVIGWQTDNELNTSASTSYSESTRREFQQYLEAKYLNIDALNHAWGGDFWATGYHNFDQVVILRQGNPGWFIFHNLGRLDGIDFRGQFSADLPDGIETTLRVGNGQQLLFVLNTTDTATQVAGLPRGVDLLGAALNNGSIELEADGCAIIELER